MRLLRGAHGLTDSLGIVVNAQNVKFLASDVGAKRCMTDLITQKCFVGLIRRAGVDDNSSIPPCLDNICFVRCAVILGLVISVSGKAGACAPKGSVSACLRS